MSVGIAFESNSLIRVSSLHEIMNGDDEDQNKWKKATPEDEREAEPVKGGADLWKEAILQIVDEALKDALKEALELRAKGRSFKSVIEDELGRIRAEVRKAVMGATDTISPFDMTRLRVGLKGRSNTLMTRVRDEDLKRIDLLVEAGLFESRSECAAFLINAGLEARQDLIDKVEETARRIAGLKEQLRRELSGEA